MQNLLFHAKGQACIGTEFLALQGTAQQDGLIGMRPNARCWSLLLGAFERILLAEWRDNYWVREGTVDR
jgi:hypothetical protein